MTAGRLDATLVRRHLAALDRAASHLRRSTASANSPSFAVMTRSLPEECAFSTGSSGAPERRSRSAASGSASAVASESAG